MILVTGASGFVGGAVVRRLVASGRPCRALLRSENDVLPAAVEPAVVRDIQDAEGLQRALSGVRTVIHLAGRAHVVRESSVDPYAAFRAVNVDGTVALAESAVRAGVERFVFLSSVATFGSDPAGIVNDDTPARPDTPYGLTKLEAEQQLADIRVRTGLDVVALRAPAVLGPGMRGNPLRLLGLVRRRIPLPFARLHERRSFIFVDNLAQAIDAATVMTIEDPRPYVVSDGTTMSTAELVRAMGDAIGVRVRMLGLPGWALSAVGAVGDQANRVRPVPVSSYEIRRLTLSFVIDGSRFAAEADFHPQLSPADGMRRIGEGS